MTIDGTNISTFGLKLSYFDGHLNQPARKKILSEQAYTSNDLNYEAKEYKVSLIGRYLDNTELFSSIQALKDLIASDVIHAFNISEHSVTFSGVVRDGIKIEPIRTAVRVNFTITKTE